MIPAARRRTDTLQPRHINDTEQVENDGIGVEGLLILMIRNGRSRKCGIVQWHRETHNILKKGPGIFRNPLMCRPVTDTAKFFEPPFPTKP